MSSAGGRLDDTRPTRARVVELAYAGVEFELVIHGELSFALPPEYGDYVAASGTQPCAARVICAVRADLSQTDGKRWPNRVEYTAAPAAFSLRGDHVSADVDEISRGHFVASARIVPGPIGWAALLRFMAAGIVERCGGASFHAAALAIDGRAVLLMGPSGSGKSTACDLSPGSRCLAYDQVVVYPTRGGYFAWALPWGEATELPRTPVPALPLSACLRVTRGTPETRVWSAGPDQALFELRSAVAVKDTSLEAEERRLQGLLALLNAAPVGFVSTVLGQRADLAIASWLSDKREVAA